MTTDDDLASEQAYIRRAEGQLARMRTRAEDLLASMAGADPDLEWALLRRVRSLAPSSKALCFGRIQGGDGTDWYIGRRHVEDEEADPLVVEWRAPVALPYYRAGWEDPMGLVRRRQFVVDGSELLSIGDDDFGAGAVRSAAPGGRRGGEALLIELERARSGEMQDIVATIQPEQDAVIRAAPAGVLAVQGGPGSGKTAVGLHRAAFLLYGDDAMARANILVVGPNRTFLRYIASVLPSLGESAVVQTTLVDLVPEISGTLATEEPATERVKGDGRMATVIANALARRRHHAPDDLVAAVGVRRLVLPAAEVDALADAVAARPLPYADGRDVLRRRLQSALATRWEELTGAPPPDGAAFERNLREDGGLAAGLDARWPTVAATALIGDLLTKPGVLAEAAAGVLDPAEQQALRRRRARAWTAADGPLVDEAKAAIAGQSRTYGHAIVDEAQDLSPMALRMLARRCPSGSMTLLGDLAQSVGVWGLAAWSDVGAWLPTGSGLRTVELRLGYRSPAQVLELAGRLLPEAAPTVTPTEAVRPGRSQPRLVRASPADLVATAAGEAVALAETWPTVGVIAPADLVSGLVAALRIVREPRSVGEAAVDGLGRPVTVVSAEGAKGLEFDAVVVVEPAAVVEERTDRPAGLRLLYVALTRPTQHLSIVAAQDLPAALGTI